ncbi:MAG TPA: metallophosphoesterase family protein [Phycisphaerales bacterium]|nr:metallophosphoesterase family protein [Phycisphaerales bacterium]
MPTAVISDIHANAAALKVVLADIEKRGIKRIVCLGDTVGYGPDPLECVDLVRERCAWTLMGNHDYGVLYEPTNFNAAAESAAFWTRQQFDQEPDDNLRAQRYDFLNRLKVRVVERIGTDGAEPVTNVPAIPGHPLLAVHGSPRRPINEYIFPDDAINATDKLESIFDRVGKICIVGHTHVPGVFTNEPDFYPPAELGENGYKFQEGEKAVINVGSVGQPRDGDPRASYVILHPTHAQFIRLEYDVAATAERIKAIPELGTWLGDRLYKGQ